MTCYGTRSAAVRNPPTKLAAFDTENAGLMHRARNGRHTRPGSMNDEAANRPR